MAQTGKTFKNLADSDLYSRYSGLLSLSNLSLQLVDSDGEIRLEFNPSPDFCKLICQKEETRICPDCIAALQQGQRGRFTCSYGLTTIILPIDLNGETMGGVVGGQVFLPEDEYRKYLIDIAALAREKELEPEFVAKTIASLKTVEESKVDVHEQLGSYIAQNVADELSEHHTNTTITKLSIEKEMLEKRILDLGLRTCLLSSIRIFCSIP